MVKARYRRIVFFFARMLFSLALWELLLPRLGMRRRTKQTRSERLRRAAISFRRLAIQMGGVMIKVGQFLSSRVDVLPPEFTRELAGLQDEVPPADFEDIRRLAEAEFGMPLLQKFTAFEETPLAAASLGQVHRARIQHESLAAKSPTGNGRKPPKSRSLDVVVKVQRPGIDKIITTDLAALRTVGKWLKRYRPISRRANVPALLDEFERVLGEEIDYLNEGRNAETFSVNFLSFPTVRVPHVIWTHTTRRALTLENVWAIKITDYTAISAAGIDRKEVASRLLDVYLKQIFEDGFFHADPHPGNLFVTPMPHKVRQAEPAGRPPARQPSTSNDLASVPWELTFVDFGMVGHVPSNLRSGLREMLIGIGTRDAARVVKAYQMMDMLLPGADLTQIEKAGDKIFEHFWGKNMTELSSVSIEEMNEVTEEFRDLLYEMPFQVPQNVIFLARCVGILSGMCTGLDPELNLWDHLAPYAQRLIADEIRSGHENWMLELGNLARTLVTVPQKVDSMLTRIERGEVAVRTPEMTPHIQRLERALRQVSGSIFFAALLMGSIQLYLGGQDSLSALLLAGAGLSILWMLLNGRKHNGK